MTKPTPEQAAAYSKTYNFDPPPPSRKKGLFIWIAIIAGVIIIAFLLSQISCSRDNQATVSFPSKPYIGVIHVEGMISSADTNQFGQAAAYQHQFTLDAIDDLINDDNNRALILYVDSPGGGVYESDELYFKIKEYQAATERPVYSYMAAMAASGGYYISAPADEIIANRNCWTGSIGVTLGTLLDLSQFLADHGIKTNTFTSGRNKAMGSMTEPMTDEQRAIFQSLVDEAYEQFVGLVAENREMDIAKAKALADGRIYTAQQALDNGLIDKIEAYDNAIDYIKLKNDLADAEVFDILYQDRSLYAYLFGQSGFPGVFRSDSEILLDLARTLQTRPVSYLCEPLAFR